MRNIKTILTILAVVILAGGIFSCFDPWQDDNSGELIINFGGSEEARTLMPWPTDPGTDILDNVSYIITLEGAGQTIELTSQGGSVRHTVTVGRYTVTVKANIEGAITPLTPSGKPLDYAEGTAFVDVIGGQATSVTIKMEALFCRYCSFYNIIPATCITPEMLTVICSEVPEHEDDPPETGPALGHDYEIEPGYCRIINDELVHGNKAECVRVLDSGECSHIEETDFCLGTPDLVFTTVNGEWAVGINKTLEAPGVCIPTYHPEDGKPVVSIIEFAFGTNFVTYNPNDYKTFPPNEHIKIVAIGNNITSIGVGAFQQCPNLEQVTISASVTFMDIVPFQVCPKLTEIIVDGDNLHFSSEDGILYNKDKTTLLAYPSAAGNIEILDSVTSIYRNAFGHCGLVESVKFPADLQTIGDQAFLHCTGLKSIEIQGSVTSIGGQAFQNCTDLASVEIQGNVNSIGNYAFTGCTGLTSVEIQGGINGSIGNYAFQNCTSLAEIEIKGNVYSIGDYAFYNCTSLKNIEIPANVSAIGNNVFLDCINLENLTVANGSTRFIAEGNILYTLNNNSEKITLIVAAPKGIQDNIIVPASVTSISNNAFRYCINLKNIIIPDSVNTIGQNAFLYCTSLESMTIPFVGNTRTANQFLGYLFGSSVSASQSGVSASLKTVVVTGGNGNNRNAIPQNAFYSCKDITKITLPETITSIGNSAFYNCSSLTEINIPAGVTSIGSSAFYDCASLTDIEIPTGVTTINSSVFYGCTNLASINIHTDITSIGDSAFRNSGLTEIEIPASVTTIGTYVFYGCNSLAKMTIPRVSIFGLYFGTLFGATSAANQGGVVPASLKTVIIKDGDSIPNNAFQNCANITSIELPANLQTIGSSAFNGCTNLTGHIVIPESVTSIGGSAFQNCNNITGMTIPFIGQSRTAITYTWFGFIFGAVNVYNTYSYVPESLKKVVVTGGNTIGNSAFSGCYYIESITLPAGITSIGDNAFSNCRALTEINIPVGVTSIGNSVFQFCESLTEINIPTGVTKIGNGAFAYCTGLTEINIPAGVTSIGDQAFARCESLTEITISANVTSIGNYAFQNCTSLENINVNNSNQNYASENGILYNKAKTELIFFPPANTATIINIPASVTSIVNFAFQDCTSLTAINIPSGITSIGDSAFNGCTGLTEIKIPASVTTIGTYVFRGCNSLTKMTIPRVSIFGSYFGTLFGATSAANQGGVVPASLKTVVIEDGESIPNNAFQNCASITSIELPANLQTIGNSAFSGCAGLTEIAIPASVISIGNSAFVNCTDLEIIIINRWDNGGANPRTTLGTTAFTNNPATQRILVPADSAATYRSSTNWNASGVRGRIHGFTGSERCISDNLAGNAMCSCQ
jgi:hypothetical protein